MRLCVLLQTYCHLTPTTTTKNQKTTTTKNTKNWQLAAHSEHRFPAPSSKLCQNWLRHCTEGGHSLSPLKLSTDAVSAFRKFWVQRLWKQHKTQAPMQTWDASAPGKKEKEKRKEFPLDSNDFVFISAGVSNVVIYKRNVWYNLSHLLQTYRRLSIIEKLFVSWQFFET